MTTPRLSIPLPARTEPERQQALDLLADLLTVALAAGFVVTASGAPNNLSIHLRRDDDGDEPSRVRPVRRD